MVLACRCLDKGSQVAAQVVHEAGGAGAVEAILCDLSSLAGAARLAAAYQVSLTLAFLV